MELQVAGERLAEPPVRRHEVVEGDGLAVGDGDFEREALSVEVRERVPVGSPVVRHGHPVAPRLGPPDVHGSDGPRPGDVGDEHEVEVTVAVDGEAHPAALDAGHPQVDDRDDAAAVDPDLLPGGLRHVEVGARWVAPAAAVAGQVPVGRAEVGDGDGDGDARPAPGPVRLAVAHQLVALPARRAVREEGGAECRRPRAVALRVQVAVPARASCTCVGNDRRSCKRVLR
jgi:hypothetical protein